MANENMFEPNKQYSASLPIWRKCRDCSDGQDALQAADLASQGTYLRALNPANTSAENIAKNKAYIKLAGYQNFVGSTVVGFMGMAYNSAPANPELPPRLQYIINNVNGTGLSIEQQSRRTLENVIEAGRHGLLTEMPDNDGNVSMADEQAGMRPYIAMYLAESIYDWYPGDPTPSNPLQWVILKEEMTRADDSADFKTEEVTVWRVLHIKDGAYHQTVYEPDADGNYSPGGIETQIFSANRMSMDHIPFTFVGSVDNEPSVDKPLILDIANTSLTMYQADADLRISSFGFSAGTLAIADDGHYSAVNDPNNKGDGVQMGDGKAIIMRNGGVAKIIVPPENPLAAKIKETDQSNLAELGAQVIMPTAGVTSIAEVKNREGMNASKLTVTVNNVSDAYNQQITYCAEFLGVEVDPSAEKFAINTKFFDDSVTPEELRELVSSWQSGFVSKDVAQRIGQERGFIPADVDIAEMNDIIDQAPSGNLDLDVDIDAGAGDDE